MSDVPANGSDLAAPFASPTPGKRGRPERSQSAKSNKEQKKTLVKPELALIESTNSKSNASNKSDRLVPMASGVNGEKSLASVQGNYGSAMERAKEVQVKLPEEHPSFVKYMLQSHVIRGFSLGLPCDFCNKHLPKHDITTVLEDEDGCNYHTKYLVTKQGLSAGWRGFAISHGIKLGDVVVFQLVYILRANNLSTTDGALGLLCLQAGKEKMSSKSKFTPFIMQLPICFTLASELLNVLNQMLCSVMQKKKVQISSLK